MFSEFADCLEEMGLFFIDNISMLLWGFAILIMLIVLCYFLRQKIMMAIKSVTQRANNAIANITTAVERVIDAYSHLVFFALLNNFDLVFLPLAGAIALPILTWERNRRIDADSKSHKFIAFLWPSLLALVLGHVATADRWYLVFSSMFLEGDDDYAPLPFAVESPGYEIEWPIIPLTFWAMYWIVLPVMPTLHKLLWRGCMKQGRMGRIVGDTAIPLVVSLDYVLDTVANPIPLLKTIVLGFYEHVNFEPPQLWSGGANSQEATKAPTSSNNASEDVQSPSLALEVRRVIQSLGLSAEILAEILPEEYMPALLDAPLRVTNSSRSSGEKEIAAASKPILFDVSVQSKGASGSDQADEDNITFVSCPEARRKLAIQGADALASESSFRYESYEQAVEAKDTPSEEETGQEQKAAEGSQEQETEEQPALDTEASQEQEEQEVQKTVEATQDQEEEQQAREAAEEEEAAERHRKLVASVNAQILYEERLQKFAKVSNIYSSGLHPGQTRKKEVSELVDFLPKKERKMTHAPYPAHWTPNPRKRKAGASDDSELEDSPAGKKSRMMDLTRYESLLTVVMPPLTYSFIGSGGVADLALLPSLATIPDEESDNTPVPISCSPPSPISLLAPAPYTEVEDTTTEPLHPPQNVNVSQPMNIPSQLLDTNHPTTPVEVRDLTSQLKSLPGLYYDSNDDIEDTGLESATVTGDEAHDSSTHLNSLVDYSSNSDTESEIAVVDMEDAEPDQTKQLGTPIATSSNTADTVLRSSNQQAETTVIDMPDADRNPLKQIGTSIATSSHVAETVLQFGTQTTQPAFPSASQAAVEPTMAGPSNSRSVSAPASDSTQVKKDTKGTRASLKQVSGKKARIAPGRKLPVPVCMQALEEEEKDDNGSVILSKGMAKGKGKGKSPAPDGGMPGSTTDSKIASSAMKPAVRPARKPTAKSKIQKDYAR